MLTPYFRGWVSLHQVEEEGERITAQEKAIGMSHKTKTGHFKEWPDERRSRGDWN